MNTNNKAHRLLAATNLAVGYMVMVLALAVFGLSIAGAPGASAAPATSASQSNGDDVVAVSTVSTVPTTTGTPQTTRTPRPIKLRSWVQFGHARPGGTATYHKLLFNHLSESGEVNLTGASLRNWDVTVDPAVATTLPGYANVITVTVGVPLTPTHHVDIERVRGVLSSTEPYTTTAFLITVARRRPFADLPEGHWADDPIQYLMDQGVISGYADGSFHPNDNVTRAQFAKMLVGVMGWTLINPQSPTFSDVPKDYWAYGYIETAVAHGVIGGYSDGAFQPNTDVTRGQVAKIVFGSLNWQMNSPTLTNFSDVSPGDWTYTYAQAISSAEVMSGYADNSFRPNAPATRAQIAKILALAIFSDPNS